MNTEIEPKVLVQIPSFFFLDESWKDSVKLRLVRLGLKIQDENEDAIKRLPENHGKIILGMLPQVGEALLNNVDIEAIKNQLAKLYAEHFYAWLCQTMGAGCGSNVLEFAGLRDGTHILVNMPVKRINRLRETTNPEWMRDLMKGNRFAFSRPIRTDVFQLEKKNASKWLKKNPEPMQWDAAQLGVLLASWMLTHDFFLREIGRWTYNKAVESSDFSSFMDTVCLNLDLDKVEFDLFGCHKMERQIERLAKEYMEDPFWVKNAVERMQEPLVEHNDDIIDLIVGAVGLYRTRDTSSFLPTVEPFWNAIKSHALEQARREIEDPEEDDNLID